MKISLSLISLKGAPFFVNICHLEIPKSELLQDKNVLAQEHAPDTF